MAGVSPYYGEEMATTKKMLDPSTLLKMFDRATARQLERQSKQPVKTIRSEERGWTREELYERGQRG
jgi:hypothetical protein